MDAEIEPIRESIITTAVTNWLEQKNPFSDFVFPTSLLNEVMDQLNDEVDRNDVDYVWKLLTEDGYFRKRGKSRRITAKEIDEASELGISTPLDAEVQDAILRELATAEREDVGHPELSRTELIDRLDIDDEAVVDFNLFYCRSKGWAEVGVYISENPWEHAEITRFGRELAVT